jgi:hypothetical protein
MSVIINPIINRSGFFESTGHRFFNLIRPIQATRYKSSDFWGYVATPVIDSFVLEPVFAFDACIHLLNAVASFGKAAYEWTMNQQNSTHIIDERCAEELNEAWKHSIHALSAIVAQTINTVLSVLVLLTRPIASLVHAVTPAYDQPTLAMD